MSQRKMADAAKLIKMSKSLDKLKKEDSYPKIITSPRTGRMNPLKLKISKKEKFVLIDHILSKYYKKRTYKKAVTGVNGEVKSSRIMKDCKQLNKDIEKLNKSLMLTYADNEHKKPELVKFTYAPNDEIKPTHIGKGEDFLMVFRF